MKKTKRILLLMAMPCLLQGCVGHDRALFVTKTNVGVDLDTQPPTAQINIARKEAVIEPTFANGETPPVLGSFAMNSRGMFADVSSTFSGGDAAVTMATLYSDDTVRVTDSEYSTLATNFDSTIELENAPTGGVFRVKKGLLGGEGDTKIELNGPQGTKPFYFATVTSIGLKATWNGATGPAPDSFKLGFNRKEFAWAPVFGEPKPNERNKHKVKMPSFLATIDSSSGASTMSDTGVAVVQHFATGKAADRMALRKPVRMAMAKRLDPAAAKEIPTFTVEPDPNSAKIQTWLYPNGVGGDYVPENLEKIKAFINSEGLNMTVTDFIDSKESKTERQKFVSQESL